MVGQVEEWGQLATVDFATEATEDLSPLRTASHKVSAGDKTVKTVHEKLEVHTGGGPREYSSVTTMASIR